MSAPRAGEDPLDRAATEALLDEADKWLGMGRADRPYPTVQRASDDLIVRLAAALRAAHAALDGATRERVCACGHGRYDHYASGPCIYCAADYRRVSEVHRACRAFTPTHERVTVTRALPEGGRDGE